DDIAHADRTIELAGIGRGADQNHFHAVDILAGLLGFGALFRVFLFQALAVGFEDLAVGFVGAQRLLLRKQEVTGVAVPHGDDVTDRAQLLDAFEQDDFHGCALLTSRDRAAGPAYGRA